MTRRSVKIFFIVWGFSSLLFCFPIITGRIHYVGDILYSFHPWLTYAAQNLQSGHFPLWNPYTVCGEPFLANPQNMLFFPGAQLFWLFPFSIAWSGFLLLNQSLLWAGGYLAAKRWIGPDGRPKEAAVLAALSLTWCGGVVVLWEFPSAGATLPFVLFFFLFSLARSNRLLAVTTTMLFFAGYTPFAYSAFLLGGLGILAQIALPVVSRPFLKGRVLLAWALALGFGVLLSLCQILPTWEVVKQSLRTAIGETEARAYLLTPVFLIKFLVPTIFDKTALPFSPAAFGGDFWPVQRSWLNTFYIGMVPTLLALTALSRLRRRTVAFLAFLTLLVTAFCMGFDPLFTIVRRLIPGMRYMTHFSTFMILPLAALSLLSGLGLQEFSHRKKTFWCLLGGAVLLLLPGVCSAAVRLRSLHALLGLQTLTPLQDRHVLLACGRGLGALTCLAMAMILPERARFWTLIFLTLGDLWLFGRDLHPVTDPSFFHRDVPLARYLQNSPRRFCISPDTMRRSKPMAGDTLEQGYQSLRQSLYPNIHLPFRVYSTWGYEVFPGKSFAEFRRNLGEDWLRGAPINFMGAADILSTNALSPPAKLVAQAPQALLYSNANAQPRVTWVSKGISVSDSDSRLRYLATDWNPRQEVVLEVPAREAKEGAADDRGEPINAAETGLLWKESPGRLEASGSGAAGWLVYSEAFYPGWEAYVNGNRARLERANHAFQTVKTPSGKWRCWLVYRPRTFRIGLTLLAGGWLFLGVAAWRKTAVSLDNSSRPASIHRRGRSRSRRTPAGRPANAEGFPDTARAAAAD